MKATDQYSLHDLNFGFLIPVVLAMSCLVVSCTPAELIDRKANLVRPSDPVPEVHPETRALHAELFIADLHADTMLWDRDFLAEADYGHVDLPRLVRGNVALQVLAVVTQTPLRGAAPDPRRLTNPNARQCISQGNLNLTGLLSVAQFRPLVTWFDLRARACSQIERLKRFVAESEQRFDRDQSSPYLMLIETRGDLDELSEKRREGVPVVGVLLSVEGAHWVGGGGTPVDEAVHELFDSGVRMLGPVHRFNNALGASSEGCDQTAGFTEDGIAFLRSAEDIGVVVDLAHATDFGTDQALNVVRHPVVISHAGVRRHCRWNASDDDCDFERNLADDQVRNIARSGGVIGIGYWPGAVGRGLDSVVEAFVHAHAILSAEDFVAEMRAVDPDYDPFEHMALGSDFDGAVETPFDSGQLIQLTQALRNVPTADGAPLFDNEAIRLIYGENFLRILEARLPEHAPQGTDGTSTGLGRVCGAPLTFGP